MDRCNCCLDMSGEKFAFVHTLSPSAIIACLRCLPTCQGPALQGEFRVSLYLACVSISPFFFQSIHSSVSFQESANAFIPFDCLPKCDPLALPHKMVGLPVAGTESSCSFLWTHISAAKPACIMIDLDSAIARKRSSNLIHGLTAWPGPL